MHEILFAYFQRSFPLATTGKALIERVTLPRNLQKGEFLQREGDPARYGAFVTRGFLRSYVIDNKGKEHVVQFAPENWWISDKAGLVKEAKAGFFIDAIEDSDVLLIDHDGHLALMNDLPGYAASFQTGQQKRTAAKDNRIVNTLSATAEERYTEFISTYPSIAMRVPLHMLASYLGITPETLSRIRKLQTRKKK